MHSWIALIFLLGPPWQTPDNGKSVTPTLEPVQFLIGNWQGHGNGEDGPSIVTHTIEPVLAGAFLRWRTRAVFQPGKDGPEKMREDIGFFSYNPAKKKIVLRQFLSDGSVITYELAQASSTRIVLASREMAGASGSRARLTISVTGPGRYTSILELAQTGNNFAINRKQTMRKLDPENWITGIDVSHFSGSVDWTQIKAAGYRFAFAKATEGNDWVDPTFQGNMDAIRKTGLVRGAYHFFVAHDEPETQARNFIQNAALMPGDLAPVVDIETLSNQPVTDLAARLGTWLEIVEKHYRVKPIIYTSHNFWNAHLDAGFSRYPLWVAEYDANLPRLPTGWEVWSFWQFEGEAKPAGVEKTVDLNYFNGEPKDLEQLLIPSH